MTTFIYLFLFYFLCLVNEGREDPHTAISGTSSARRRNAVYMASRWRADDGPTLNAGLIALWFSGDLDRCCFEALCFFVILQGGPDPLSPLWIRP